MCWGVFLSLLVSNDSEITGCYLEMFWERNILQVHGLLIKQSVTFCVLFLFFFNVWNLHFKYCLGGTKYIHSSNCKKTNLSHKLLRITFYTSFVWIWSVCQLNFGICWAWIETHFVLNKCHSSLLLFFWLLELRATKRLLKYAVGSS